MIPFLLKRLLASIPVLLGVAFITQVLFGVAGGDPCLLKLGKNPSEQEVELCHVALGLDQPFFSQYLDFLWQTLTLDFGVSWSYDTPVREIFALGLGPTLSLSVPAFLIGGVISVALAMLVAFYRGTALDRVVTAGAIAGISISSLIYILVGQWLLADQWKLFPIWGYEYGFDALTFLALPVLIWVALSVGTDVRYFRTVALEEISRDYVRTARAKGISEMRVLFVHVLRNSAVPIVTRFTVIIPFLITGSFLMEIFFGIPGLGSTLYTAVVNSDLPVVKAITMLGATLYVVFNVVADVLYALVDPRIRVGG